MKASEDFERRDMSADTIIEELKSLAKSMLESTEAVRQRTRNIEGCKSYDALLNVLESTHSHTNRALDPQVCQTYIDPNGKLLSPEEEKGFLHNAQQPLCYNNLMNKSNANVEAGDGELENTDDVFSMEEGYDDVSAEKDVYCNQLKKKSSNACAAAADFSADSDDNIYDGVKTQVVFKAVDPALYREISSCTWLPEPLRLHHETGEAMEVASEDIEDDVESSEVDDSKGSSKRVFRVPAFPYGGGITEAQVIFLSRTFNDTINNPGVSLSNRPAYITKKNFTDYNYQECAVTEGERRLFKPSSPFEFVVEIERDIVFDAVRAKEQRRCEFRRLAEEGKAPVTMGSFNLRVIMDPLKTGFEEEKTFPIERGTIVADRYQIVEMLGKATFSRAVRCYDLCQPLYEEDDAQDTEGSDSSMKNGNQFNVGANGGRRSNENKKKIVGYAEVCLKIINNSKDFFDQSLDEIRLLTLINKHRDPDKAHVIRLIDSFYYKEHTMLVTELLSDNLYEYSKYNREEEDTFYFTLPRLRRIARQITEALEYVHGLNLIHADLKPENILFVSHRRCIVKVIDFGSSCFLSDHLSSYIQSRSYRAPEVILGCDYDGRIDVWSLGAIMVELVTGEVLFTSETVPEMLARIVYVCGRPLPRRMLWEGRHTAKFINKFGCIYEQGNKDGEDSVEDSSYYYLYTPVHENTTSKVSGKKTSIDVDGATNKNVLSVSEDEMPYRVLRQKLAAHDVTDNDFLSFVEACLTLDHKARPTSKELLSHPFLARHD
ncbi:protein kinase [Trypanosoma vivax]|nr:protein kinase [Trypanosoma vivax]